MTVTDLFQHLLELILAGHGGAPVMLDDNGFGVLELMNVQGTTHFVGETAHARERRIMFEGSSSKPPMPKPMYIILLTSNGDQP